MYGPGHIVLDVDPASPTEMGTAAPIFRPMSVVAKRLHISPTTELLLQLFYTSVIRFHVRLLFLLAAISLRTLLFQRPAMDRASLTTSTFVVMKICHQLETGPRFIIRVSIHLILVRPPLLCVSAWLNGSALVSINEVTLRRTRFTNHMRYFTTQAAQLSQRDRATRYVS